MLSHNVNYRFTKLYCCPSLYICHLILKKIFKITTSQITQHDLTSVQNTIDIKIPTASTNLVSNAESNYLTTTDDTMDGVLSFGPRAYLQFADNSIIWNIAFSHDKDTTLSTVNSKTTALYHSMIKLHIFTHQPAVLSDLFIRCFVE
jgi:hypothetical protein